MKILSEGSIGKLRLKNRVIMAPMNVGGLNDSDGKLSSRGIDYFVERAKGGTGLIVVGFTRVTREFEQSPDTILARNTLADDKIHVSWMSELAERCHDYDAKLAIQLSPGVGRQAGGYAQSKGIAIGPSEINCYWPPHSKTKALTRREIKKNVDAFQLASYHAKVAGIDAIHLHGHEGYLLDQFKTTLWNHRTDEYGGSLENRMRFSIEIINAIKKGAGKDFPIIYRYGLSHFTEDGRNIEEGLEIAKILEQAGVDALDIDSGCYENWYLPHPPSTMKPGFKIDLAKKVKEVVNIPVIASGKLGYPNIAQKAVLEGKADFICLGRPLIADPEWVLKLKENRPEDIRPCIGCHEGCLKRIYDHKYISCAVNPAAGIEKMLIIEKTNIKKNVLVIGGGVAGLEAARVLALRGHKVLLLEQNSSLGGNFRNEYLPDFKDDYRKFIQYLVTQITKLGVNILTNHPFSETDYLNFNPEIVFIATGAEPIVPKINGIDQIKKISTLNAFSTKCFKGKIIVLGGGLVGTEAAINMAQNGANVTLIEKLPIIAKDAFIANRKHLEILLKDNNVKVYNNTEVICINNNNIHCIDNEKNEFNILADSLVVCTGMIPNKKLLNYFNDKKITTISIGDTNEPRKVIDAVWEAFRKARLV
jgi:2-enoate reductase